MENTKYGRRREGQWTPIRAKAQDTKANSNSWKTHLVRKRWDIGLLRALSLWIMMMMMIYIGIYRYIGPIGIYQYIYRCKKYLLRIYYVYKKNLLLTFLFFNAFYFLVVKISNSTMPAKLLYKATLSKLVS